MSEFASLTPEGAHRVEQRDVPYHRRASDDAHPFPRIAPPPGVPIWLAVRLRGIANPKLIVVLLFVTAALCLGTLIYVQRENNAIVNRDMEAAVSFSELASRFEQIDGEVYRLLVDLAVDSEAPDIDRRIGRLQNRLDIVRTEMLDQRDLVARGDQARVVRAAEEISTYSEAIGVVGTMLDIDFATSVSMLRPFRDNTQQTLAEVRGISAIGVADARRHADAAAGRTFILVGIATLAIVIVTLLSYLWLALAVSRGTQLKAEIAKRSDAEREALHLAQTDGLTGLVNRRQFNARLESALEDAALNGTSVTVMLLDLDGFKDANDTYGHAAGDAALRTVAKRLRTLFRKEDVVARLGGDEFAVLIHSQGTPADLVGTAERICNLVQQPFNWNDSLIRIGASVGAARYPHDGTTMDEILHCADTAMYQVKKSIKGGVCIFSPEIEFDRLEKKKLSEDLRRGIACGEIVPYYQPIVNFADNSIYGFEILARWEHPTKGLIEPARFLPIADKSAQIMALSLVVLRQACRHARQMPTHQRIALNVSPLQLQERELARDFIEIIKAEGIDPSRIEIEITEDAVINETETVERIMQDLRNIGMTIALDDFGTGYSNLANLRRLKFDSIKIDRSFVSTILESAESDKLVAAIINLADSFGMEITAEGIENAPQALLMATKGCTRGQGFHYGRPKPFAQLDLAFGHTIPKVA